MDEVSTRELEARRSALLRQLRRAGPVLEGSIAMVARRCGTAGCRCMQGGEAHRAMILCKKEHGRSVATYIPKAMHEQVRQWNAEHKRLKRVLKEISAIDEQIVKQHVSDARRERQLRRSMKVVEGGRRP